MLEQTPNIRTMAQEYVYLATICLQNKTDMQVIYRIKFLTGQNSWVRVPKSRVLNNS